MYHHLDLVGWCIDWLALPVWLEPFAGLIGWSAFEIFAAFEFNLSRLVACSLCCQRNLFVETKIEKLHGHALQSAGLPFSFPFLSHLQVKLFFFLSYCSHSFSWLVPMAISRLCDGAAHPMAGLQSTQQTPEQAPNITQPLYVSLLALSSSTGIPRHADLTIQQLYGNAQLAPVAATNRSSRPMTPLSF